VSTDFLATFNPENKTVFGVVKDRYKIIQNVDAFGFFDEIVKSGEAVYESVGALGMGERIWILARLPKNTLIFKNIDIIENYLLLTNSHDGKGSLLMYFTPVRVVCQNTLNQSIGNRTGETVHIRHIGNIKDKISEARRILGLGLDFAQVFEKTAKELVQVKLTDDRAGKYFDRVLKIEGKTEEDISTRQENVRRDIFAIYKKSEANTIQGIENTLWTAYNAVTEYTDHYKTVKNNRRLESIIFGSGADLKHRAWEQALVEIGK